MPPSVDNSDSLIVHLFRLNFLMKRKFMFGLGLAAMVAAPLAVSTPVFANLQEVGSAIAQRIMGPEVKLNMSVEKQVTVIDENGVETKEWQALESGATVQPGDALRYSVESSNAGDVAAENLVVNQPIASDMTFVLNSEKGNSAAEATYSIDNGQTYVAEPMVEVTLPDGTVEMQPAPAEAYTHVKWNFEDALDAEEIISVSHEVTVN
ncbi:MAG: hypothetical protein AAFQ63_19545 [Cyanobacteria bacterium J06621_11]